MADLDSTPALKARVVELELEVSSLKAQLRRSEALLFEATNKTVKPNDAIQVGSYLRNNKPSSSSGVSAARASMRQHGVITLKLMSMRRNDTNAVRTQIVEWINMIMPIEPALTPENLMDRLSTGIILCDLALLINESAIDHLGRIHTNAKPYSLLAHENIQAFIRCSIRWGVNPHECCCANDILSSNPEHRDERAVLFTLLALSRVVYHKFNIEPPAIIAAEALIDSLDAADTAAAPAITAAEAADAATAAAGDGASDKDATGLTSLESEQIHEALQAFCLLHQISPMPQPTQRRGEYIFADNTTAHVRVFDADSNRDGDVLSGVQDGSVALLVRHKKKEWVNLLAFAEDHKEKKGGDAGCRISSIAGADGAASGVSGVTGITGNIIGGVGASAGVAGVAGVAGGAVGANGVLIAGESVLHADGSTTTASTTTTGAGAAGDAGVGVDGVADSGVGVDGFTPIAVNITVSVDSMQRNPDGTARVCGREGCSCLTEGAEGGLEGTGCSARGRSCRGCVAEEGKADEAKEDEDEVSVDGVGKADKHRSGSDSVPPPPSPEDADNDADNCDDDDDEFDVNALSTAFNGRTRSQAMTVGSTSKNPTDPDADAMEEVILPTGQTSLTALMNTRDYEHFRRVATGDMACMTDEERKLMAEYTAKQEFFYLTALSVKMTHALRDDVTMVPTDVLWRLVLEKQLPFHRFHSFVQHEITKKYLEAETMSRMEMRTNLRKHRESMVAVLQARQRHRSSSIMDE